LRVTAAGGGTSVEGDAQPPMVAKAKRHDKNLPRFMEFSSEKRSLNKFVGSGDPQPSLL